MDYTIDEFRNELIELRNVSPDLDTKDNIEYFYKKFLNSNLKMTEVIKVINEILQPLMPITKLFVIERLNYYNLNPSVLNFN
jgi:hypothetical protein